MIANFVLVLSLIMLFAGLAIDISSVQLRQVRAQAAADAAAIGASYEKARGNANWVSAGQADAALNGFTNGVNGAVVSIVNPPTGGSYSGNSSAIQATVTQTVTTTFMARFTAHPLPSRPGPSPRLHQARTASIR
jgi:uncharacterized membrane protein